MEKYRNASENERSVKEKMMKDRVNQFVLLGEKYRAKYNKKESRFRYNIDSFHIDEEECTIIIRGWGFSTVDWMPFDFRLPQGEGKPQYVRRIIRDDINDTFDIPKGEKLGFEIKIAEVNGSPKSLWLILKDKELIELPVRIKLTKEAGELTNMQFVNSAFSLCKRVGVREAFGVFSQKGKQYWNDYDLWVYENEKIKKKEINQQIQSFTHKPKVSIVVPVYNVDEKWMRKNIESIQAQLYTNWELCLADDCSPSPHIKRILTEYAQQDSRIKVTYRKENGHIAKATNSAIELATGDYIGFMDNDDELSPLALFEYVKLINEHPEAQFIYCDEDMIDTNGNRFNPFFKSNWNEKLLLGHNYITHFVVVRRDLLEKTGRLRTEMNGSQDYDFVLRATELTKDIYHIPKMLYHWRTIEGSVAENPEAKNYAYTAGKYALDDAMKRRGKSAEVFVGEKYGTYNIKYDLPPKTTVSIITVCMDATDEHSYSCLNKLLNNTTYDDLEIIAVNYNEDLICNDGNKVHYIYNNANRNENQLRNYAAQKAKGEFLIFLDEGIVPDEGNWLEQLLNEGLDETTGITGCKILNTNRKILNAGMAFNQDFTGIYYSHRGLSEDHLGYYYRLTLPQYVFAVGGGCLLIKKELFTAIGGFMTEVEGDLSAIDLCIKVREENKTVLWTPLPTLVSETASDDRKEVNKEQLEILLNRWTREQCTDNFTNPNIRDKY